MTTVAVDDIAYRKFPHAVGNRFERAATPAERKRFELPQERVRSFEENGYVAPLRLLDESQLGEMRERLERMTRFDFARADELFMAPRVKPGDKPGMIYFQGAWLVDEMFHDLVFAPR